MKETKLQSYLYKLCINNALIGMHSGVSISGLLVVSRIQELATGLTGMITNF